MRSRQNIACLAGIVLTCGCGGRMSTDAAIRPKVELTTPVSATASIQQKPLANDQLVTKTVPTIELTDSEDDLRGETDDFFAPPQVAVQPKQVSPVTGQLDPVRLIGFISTVEDNKPKQKAIVKVGNQSMVVQEGETFLDIELLDIGDRSITLQRNRERWTLTLFGQPIINAAPAVTQADSVARSSGRQRKSASREPNMPPREPMIPSTIPPLLPPPVQIQLPEIPEPPQLPSTPDPALFPLPDGLSLN